MENASKALIIAGAILIAILLISIGIILINSGRDVTSTGTTGMNSQKIQTFNSQFTAYEGTKKGTEAKSLINTINASNATDSEHEVKLLVAPYVARDKKVEDIKDTESYTIKIYYTEPGVINKNTGIVKQPDDFTGNGWSLVGRRTKVGKWVYIFHND